MSPPRPRAWPAVLLAVGLLLSGCANPSVGSADDDPKAPVTLKFWHGWSEPGEVKAIDASIRRFEKLHPNIQVKTTGNVSDATVNQALRAGGDKAPDVVSSFTTNNVGQYCDSGMWADLDPFLRKSGIDKRKVFPRTLLEYTQYEGTQCALPLLADAFGLYYNKDAFAEAGITRPPRTMSEFREDAKKLTRRDGGQVERAGFMPNFRLYQNSPDRMFAQWGPRYFDKDGKARLAKEPRTRQFFREMSRLADAQGGYRALERLRQSFGDEMSRQSGFMTGKLAMHLDGEWRGLMLKEAKPDFDWGVAPLPVPDDQADTYGRGYLTGTVAGIAHSSRHQNAAWELLRFLTTDTDQVVAFANAIHNVPSTKAALDSPRLDADPSFRTFLRIAKNPHSQALPPSTTGGQYVTAFQDFSYSVESGREKDLDKGLRELDRQIDADTLQAEN
ncbi:MULTISPECIES: ABC transporter substrate-binding protein [Streptomyces]|uniref:Probable sugar-binding periplasmic protein n=1 Tax=Streptomyces cacaoi TaxID=1898 RepID=A0A4Y3R6W0_STRCI|nr:MULTISPECIES: ABC transporter substrate-binding protein [Streptomyces]NNG88988.1 ABC transporter substrate-binding protein [Streptomyces cacaoi]QHF96489.1 ABC transporter substrate-binding protein [Streptomyces sp. NHF165]GEB52508.1 ABC transporter substrate-binding protein [Streptomyces cacaoi]